MVIAVLVRERRGPVLHRCLQECSVSSYTLSAPARKSLPLSYSLCFSLTNTHSLSHTHTNTQTHTLSLSHLKRCRPFKRAFTTSFTTIRLMT